MIQNRYLVVHLIGKGGMGEVYLAVDQRLGSAVALKRTSFAEDQMLAAAFEREAKILARLRHPVLPKVSDHFAENGEQYLVMEHISGDDLSKRLETAGKPFPVSWVMFWADQLLDALSYLHSHEPPIIHRDIKPQNLKLTDDNHIVLLDFGLSKDTAYSSVVSKSGTSGSVVGYTPHFAPMEQIRGTGTNQRSDLYSLSATLYQLTTDVVPVDALSRADSMLSGEPDPIKALSDINPEISPAVSNVILKGLEVSQEKRFATASEMQKSLRAAYAQMQGQMSADTVAFNIADHAGADLHMTSPPIDHGRSVAPSEMATITPSVPFVTAPVEATPEPVVHAEIIEEVPSMEATIQMDSPIHAEQPVHVEPPVLDSAVRQADVKTDIFLAADIAEKSFEPELVPESPLATPQTEEYSGGVVEPPPSLSTGGFEPAATVPLINVEEQARSGSDAPATPLFFETAAIEPSAAAADPPPSAPVEAEPIAPQHVPPRAKAKSRAGLLLAGLAGLFILAIVAAGAGYFAYTKYFAGKDTKPTPTPVVESSPTPYPTVEPTPSDSSSTSDTNTDSNSSNSTVTVSPTPVTNPTSGPFTKPTPQVAPTTKSAANTKPAVTPGVKATPKKPSNDRTVILQ